jgi:uncharacterized repeat protein (TIGR01451 family)
MSEGVGKYLRRPIMKKLSKLLVTLPIFVALLFVQGVASAPGIPWQDKVETPVLAAAETGETEFIIFLNQQADLRAAQGVTSKSAKGAFVYQQLARTAQSTQGAIIRTLEARGVEYRAFWVANMIWVRGDAHILETLARRADVARIYNNPEVQLDIPPLDEQIFEALEAVPADVDTVEWGINKVRAPEVWAAGYTGQGAVVGGADTGVDWAHPALKGKYRGWDSDTGTESHDYNWHDAIHSGNDIDCDLDSTEPCDDHYHGTHTMGTMVGDDGAGNQIGLAPDAKWIACRNMNEGVGTPASYIECYEWFIAPYPIGGNPLTDGDPSKAPDVINNSWSCPVSEGCTDPNMLLTVVQNVRAAGILTVHSAGNYGSSCETVYTQAAIYDESFSVGSTDQNDDISSFSSRGPVTVDGSNRLKPDVSAPGQDVRSSFPTTYPVEYGNLNGTSMAAPHVAGMAALLISARPSLAGDVDALEALIMNSAVQRTTSQLCGGISGTQVPNNTYGYGRVDAMQAVSNMPPIFELEKSVSSTHIAPGETLTYTLDITHDHPVTPTHNVSLTDTIPANTVFITGTLPHTLENGLVTWNLGDLDVGLQNRSLELVVQTGADYMGAVINDDYGLRSDELGTVPGAKVLTWVSNYIQFFPWIANLP